MSLCLPLRPSVLVLFGIFFVSLFCTAGSSPVNVYSFGAVGDGVHDDTRAFQNALDFVAVRGGGEVRVGLGRFRIDGAVTIRQGTRLVGGWRYAPVHVGDKRTWRPLDPMFFKGLGNNSVIEAYGGKGNETGTPLFSLEGNSAIVGLVIVYPQQTADLPMPIPFPWTIDLCSDERRSACATGEAPTPANPGFPAYPGFCCTNNVVENIELFNSYNGIRASRSPRYLIRNVMGQPLHFGVLSEFMFDISRIENVHFYSYFSSTDASLRFMRKHGVGFAFGRNDFIDVLNTYAWSYRTGYRFFNSTGADGGCANGNLVGIQSDFTVENIRIECTQGTGVSITNALLTAFEHPSHPGSLKDIPVVVQSLPSHQGVVRFVNSNFWGPGAFEDFTPRQHSIVSLRGEGERVFFNGCSFLQWNNTSTGASGGHEGTPALVLLEGLGSSYAVTDSNFWTSRPTAQVQLGANIGSAVVTGNTMTHAVLILGQEGSGNSSSPSDHLAVAHNVATRNVRPLHIAPPGWVRVREV